jgi:hypothetical protein
VAEIPHFERKEGASCWEGGDCPIRRKELAVTSIFYPFLNAFIMLTEILMLADISPNELS